MAAITEQLPPHTYIHIHHSYIVPRGRTGKVSSKKIEIAGRKIPVGISYAEAFFSAMNKKIQHP